MTRPAYLPHGIASLKDVTSYLLSSGSCVNSKNCGWGIDLLILLLPPRGVWATLSGFPILSCGVWKRPSSLRLIAIYIMGRRLWLPVSQGCPLSHLIILLPPWYCLFSISTLFLLTGPFKQLINASWSFNLNGPCATLLFYKHEHFPRPLLNILICLSLTLILTSRFSGYKPWAEKFHL